MVLLMRKSPAQPGAVWAWRFAHHFPSEIARSAWIMEAIYRTNFAKVGQLTEENTFFGCMLRQRSLSAVFLSDRGVLPSYGCRQESYGSRASVATLPWTRGPMSRSLLEREKDTGKSGSLYLRRSTDLCLQNKRTCQMKAECRNLNLR